MIELSQHNLKKKILRFSNTIKILLIPTRAEYYVNGLAEKLWWNRQDCKSFKYSYALELRETITGMPNISEISEDFREFQINSPITYFNHVHPKKIISTDDEKYTGDLMYSNGHDLSDPYIVGIFWVG